MMPFIRRYLFPWTQQDYLRLLLLALLCVHCPGLVEAGEVAEATVEHDRGRFTLHTDVLIEAPAARTRAVLTQFEKLPRVNPGIQSVKILGHTPDGQVRMRVRSRVCVMVMCMAYNWVQRVDMLPSGDIVTHFDPAASDFRQGWVRYRFVPEGQQTRLIMDADLTPDFWFPPVLGPWVIKNKLREEALETALSVERLARRDNGVELADSTGGGR